jgi:hypothetical protein
MNTRKDDMRHFKQWAKDKNPLFATIALIIASSVEDCCELSESVKEGKRIEGYVHLPRLRNWLKMYQNHERVVIGVFSALSEHNSGLKEIIYLYKFLLRAEKEIKRMSDEEIRNGIEKIRNEIKKMNPEELTEIIRSTNEAFEEFQEWTMDVTADDSEKKKEACDGKRDKIRELSNKAEVVFLMRVLFPCFSIYGMYPKELLGRAQQGDVDALEKLIRLDKSAMFDPKISEIVHQAQAEKIPAKMSRIKDAFRSTPKIYLTRTKIKYMLGGFISYVSEVVGKKITAAEINRLFNAVGLDMGKGGVRPSAIRTTDKFQKAIQRYRVLWKSAIPLVDKK